jgi:hypothetical protein
MTKETRGALARQAKAAGRLLCPERRPELTMEYLQVLAIPSGDAA